MPASESLEHLPREGDYVADARVADKMGDGGGVHLWSGVREDDSKAVIFAVEPGLGQIARDSFLVAAGRAAQSGEDIDGVLVVSAVDPIAGAYVGELEASGTLADLEVLNWDRDRRLRLFRRLCAIMAVLHDRGIVHGWLRPENVLLDSALNPVVANAGGIDIGDMCRTDAGMVWLHRVYAPLEVRRGTRSDMRADVYALGRLLHFALLGTDPDEKDERLPRLDALKGLPNPLIRIIRKCTVMEPGDRYDNAQEIVDELERIERHVPVGVGHPDIDGVEESSIERASSRPPGRTPSVRPSGRPSSGGVRRPSGANAMLEIPSPKKGRRLWSPAIAVALGLPGLAMLIIPILLAYLFGIDHIVIRTILWVSPIPLGLATPGFGKNKLLGRMLIVTAILGVVVFADPVTRALDARVSGLSSGALAGRVERFKALRAGGETELRGIDLATADLSGMDLSGVALDGCNFENAKLVGTKFTGASMQNVRLAGADISGADFGNVPGSFMKGVALAKCDEKTVMPFGFTCNSGTPGPAPSK